MRGDLADWGGLSTFLYHYLGLGRLQTASGQSPTGDMFYFSCLGSKKIGISSNYLGIGILHINIWLAAFVRKIELSQHWVHILIGLIGILVLSLSLGKAGLQFATELDVS